MNIYCKLVMSGILVIAAGTVTAMDKIAIEKLRSLSPHTVALKALEQSLDNYEAAKDKNKRKERKKAILAHFPKSAELVKSKNT